MPLTHSVNGECGRKQILRQEKNKPAEILFLSSDERNQEEHEKNDEQDLCYPRGCSHDAREAQRTGDKGYD